MAGAAVIAALTNALGGREFPFVFGGDGASFAVSPGDAAAAREALAATAAWADGELGLTLRVALIPLAAIRRQGLDVRVARYGPSENLSYAMFAGGGLAWADAAVKRGEFAVTPAPRRHLARSDRAVVPVRGIPRRARAHSGRAGDAGGRRRSGRVPRAHRGHRGAGRKQSRGRRAAAGRRPEARLAAAGRGARNPHAAGRRLQARARAGPHVALFPGHALGPARRRFRAGNLFAPGRGKFRLPQIRRRAAHDHRLHAGTRRHAGTAARGGQRERRITACTGSTAP